MKKTFLAAAALSICLFAASCGNDTDPTAGGTTDTTTMGPPATTTTPSDNTGSGISNSGDSTMNGGTGTHGTSGSNMSQRANNADEIQARNAAAGTAGGSNGSSDMKQTGAQKKQTVPADSVNNRTGLGQSK